MSLTATRWAWSVAVRPSTKLVLLVLAEHADESGKCWPSITRLQQLTGLARSSVAATLCVHAPVATGLASEKDVGRERCRRECLVQIVELREPLVRVDLFLDSHFSSTPRRIEDFALTT